MLISVCLVDYSILGLYYSNLTLASVGFELASIITFVLQVNRLSKSLDTDIKAAATLVFFGVKFPFSSFKL